MTTPEADGDFSAFALPPEVVYAAGQKRSSEFLLPETARQIELPPIGHA